MTETLFTPLTALIGGALIGLAAAMLMATVGRIAGISSIASRLLPPYDDGELAGRVLFLLGLALAPLVWAALTRQVPPMSLTDAPLLLTAGGALAGFGATWGRGCTSGHGVCGLARLSWPSFVAVVRFMGTAALTVFVVRHVIGVS